MVAECADQCVFMLMFTFHFYKPQRRQRIVIYDDWADVSWVTPQVYVTHKTLSLSIQNLSEHPRASFSDPLAILLET